MMPKEAKMRFCFNCGVEIGRYTDYDNLDHCGKPECYREQQNALSMNRQDAHEQLDRDNGWDGWDR
jgi:hypothetical protein